MAQIFDKPGLGEIYGQSLGQGLQQLANLKLSQLQQRQQKSEFTKGITPIVGEEVANFLSNLAPEERKNAFQNISGLLELRNQLAPQEQAQPGMPLAQQLGAQAQPSQAQQIQPQQPQLQYPQQQPQDRAKLIENIFTPPAEKRQQRALELQERESEYKQQKDIRPILHAEVVDYKAQKKAADIAQKMLKNIQEHQADWPGPLVGNLPLAAQNLFIRNPNVRKFIADANSLVSALAGTRKGVPTNFKLRLEALSKADLSQPIETQMELLKDVIGLGKQASKKQEYIASLKDTRGHYPLDVEQKLVEFDLAQDDPLKYPQLFKENTVYEDDNGQRHIVKNGAWKDI